MKSKKKIVVFASGSGTNFINIYENANNATVVLLISNNSNCGAIEYAKSNYNWHSISQKYISVLKK